MGPAHVVNRARSSLFTVQEDTEDLDGFFCLLTENGRVSLGRERTGQDRWPSRGADLVAQ